MSGETDFCIETTNVFVRLLNEGTRVLRPAPAVPRGGMRFRLIEPEDYDPEDEQWEFLPGSTVVCRAERSSEGDVLVAVATSSES